MLKIFIQILIYSSVLIVHTGFVTQVSLDEVVIFQDDFDDTSKHWVMDTRYANGVIENGYYELTSNGERSDIRMQQLDIVREENDFKVEARIKIIGDSPFSNAIVWGTWAVGGGFEEGYSFGFNSRGEYIILSTEDWVANDITNWEAASVIAPNDYNTLLLYKKGGQHLFYINGKLVKTLPSEEFIGQNFGFHAANGSTIQVDYFKVSIFVPRA